MNYFNDIVAVAPPIVLIVVGMVVLLWDLWLAPGRKQPLLLLSLLGTFAAALAAVGGLAPGERTAFGGGMISDNFGNLFNIVLCVIAGLSILMSERYLGEKEINEGEYYALIFFSTAGAMLMAMSFDLVNVFLGLEVLSVALYILSGFARRDIRSEESAVKYFLLGAFASGFLLYGTALIYGAVGLVAQNIPTLQGGSFTNLGVIAQALDATPALATSPLFVSGVALLIVGLGFKASIVPFHSYVPDVYEGAPTSVTAFMSAGAKAGAFAALIRVFEVLLPTHETYAGVLWGLAAATMIVGNVLAVRQTNIKRMLAYSSIAHAGYILVGVLAAGTQNSELSRGAVIYYLFAYTFMNLGAFALVIWLGRSGGREYLNIGDYAGLSREQPLAAAAMAVFMLSLAGIPPAAGFFGKLYLFLGAVQSGLVGLAVLGLLASVVGVYYYLNVIVAMYFRPPIHDFADVRGGGAKGAALIAAAATLVFALFQIRAFLPRLGDAPMTSPAAATTVTQAPR